MKSILFVTCLPSAASVVFDSFKNKNQRKRTIITKNGISVALIGF